MTDYAWPDDLVPYAMTFYLQPHTGGSDMRSPHWPSAASNLAAALGDTSMTLTNLAPGTKVYAGDYVGGDGRPHIILDDGEADSAGQIVVDFEPPLAAAVGVGEAVFGNPTGLFRLVSDDAGDNGATVGEAVNMTLEFVEDL